MKSFNPLSPILIIGLCFILTGCYLLPPTQTPQVSTPAGVNVITPTVSPSFTSTPISIPSPTNTTSPTSTSSPTLIPTFTITPIPIATLTKTPTPFIATYQLQSGIPVFTRNFAHPEAGCNWLGVAGQIFNASGKPVINLVVNIKGKLGNTGIDEVAITGIPEADMYGPGGYEVHIASLVQSSQNTLTIQVLDLQGKPLTKAITFSTFADCTKNLIIINFTPTVQ